MYEVKTKVIHDTRGLFSQGDITNRPSPAITIGINSLNSSHYLIEYYLTDTPPPDEDIMTINKPPYQVLSMPEIEALPWNGYNVVSTFSGCGGSCLGYRMAGYRVLWASEFIPAAQEVYKLNHPNSILDTRDIRQVQPEEILEATGMAKGEIDILDGSPPCASFSTAGKREKGWGEVKKYSDTKQRVDDLFFEYARILKGLQPKVFVAENVSGLVKGKAKGYFKFILQELKDCGYIVKAKVLDAQWLGVPQMRQRLIFVGVRKDLGIKPTYPSPLPYWYSVREALPWIVNIRHGKGFGFVEPESDISRYAIGREWDTLAPGEKSEKYLNLIKPDPGKPSPCVTQTGGNPTSASVTHPTEKRKFTIAELRRICAFPDDFQLTGSYNQQWERLGRAVPPVMMSYIAGAIRDEVLSKTK